MSRNSKNEKPPISDNWGSKNVSPTRSYKLVNDFQWNISHFAIPKPNS